MGDYTLVITEKPNAALKIAQAISSRPTRREEGGAAWYEVEHEGKRVVIVPAVGHLFTLKPSKRGWDYPTFNYEWAPSWKTNPKKAGFAKKYYLNLEAFGKGASEVIVATDYDTEGEVIGVNILRFLCEREDAKRMKFSTLTKDELREAFENPEPHLNKGHSDSGLARHQLDWLWGINSSRALTLAVKRAEGKVNFYLLSAGRVQAPVLQFLTEREKEIQAFKPDPFWEINGVFLSGKTEIPAQHSTDRFWKKPEAEKAFENSKGENAIVEDVEKREYEQKPPVPFDLTSLQTEAYNLFGYSPTQTLSIAQSLYEAGNISYPRTSSQKLPEKIGFRSILDALKSFKNYQKICEKLLAQERLVPNEGKKEDPAHPAIFPTPEIPKGKLSSMEQKVYDLIVRKFFAVFGKAAIRESVKVTLIVGGEKFIANGRRTVEKNWIEFYGPFAKFDEIIFPEMKKGDKLKQKSIEMLDKETQPPSRYSQGSVLKEMEKVGLGTKATRAAILQTLYDRNYITDKSITVTELGMIVAETLSKYVPDIVSFELTRKFEGEMELIYDQKKSKEQVIEEAKKTLDKICKEFKENEEKIGKELMKGVVTALNDKWIVGECPSCKNNLRIITSKKSGKRFIGCEGWQKKVCNFAAPLPQSGLVKTGGGTCKVCAYPIVTIIRKAKRPWRLCVNPKCPQKEEWAKSKAESEGASVTTEVKEEETQVVVTTPKKKAPRKKKVDIHELPHGAREIVKEIKKTSAKKARAFKKKKGETNV